MALPQCLIQCSSLAPPPRKHAPPAAVLRPLRIRQLGGPMGGLGLRGEQSKGSASKLPAAAAMASADSAGSRMNLNEYMVTLERPLGIRFAVSVDGKIFVHSLRKRGNAEKSRIIMVGDTLKKASCSTGSGFADMKDRSDAQYGVLGGCLWRMDRAASFLKDHFRHFPFRTCI